MNEYNHKHAWMHALEMFFLVLEIRMIFNYILVLETCNDFSSIPFIFDEKLFQKRRNVCGGSINLMIKVCM